MNREVKFLFPTPIFTSNLKSVLDIKTTLDTVKKLNNKDHNRTFVTHDKLHLEDDFKELVNVLNGEIQAYCNEIIFISFDDVVLTNMWGIIHTGHSYHQRHMHPNSFISGVLHLEVPTTPKDKNEGLLIFYDPKIGRQSMMPSVKEVNSLTTIQHHYEPEEGKLVVFPSYLEHSIELMDLKELTRVSIAFNYSIISSEVSTAKFNFKK
jgi:uncharacterized protein (TIGR02466 family)